MVNNYSNKSFSYRINNKLRILRFSLQDKIPELGIIETDM
jgi:hypothetical protein